MPPVDVCGLDTAAHKTSE